MNSKVKVVADATTKSVITQSTNNPEYGYVRLEQVRSLIDDNGFLRRKTISTLVHGTVNDLKEAGYYAGQELPGAIIVHESLTPFSKTNPERDYKVAGATGIVCTFDGMPIYRKTIYSSASNAEDILVKHDNVTQLREAYATQKTTLGANTNFDNI